MEEIRSNYECGAQKLYFKKYFYKNEDNYDILKKFKLKKNAFEEKTFKMHANHAKKCIAHVNFI